jgi:carboxyl-terminal processing protease
VASLSVIVLLLAFGAGFGLGRTTSVPVPAPQEAAASPAPALDDYALLAEMRGIIESEFYRPDSADRQNLLYGAARGMVQALGDQNSVYETPRERELGDSRWTGRYQGIGMFVDQRDGQMVVTAPVDDGPAQRAGILPGDTILEADGRALSGLTLNQQTLLIRGPKGTTVVLTVRRQGVAELLHIPVERDEIRLISARSRMLDSGLGVLRISQFTEATYTEARSALEELLANRPSGLLLDLRSNAGGLLEPAVQTTGLLLGAGPVVLESHADGSQRSYDAPEAAALTSLPMLVLVDRGTASAAEVMAAALRDRGRATLLGERTYGKSTVQYIHKLSDGSGLRITVAQWHTPSGAPIPSTGLDPDWVVASPTTPVPGQDPLLDVAVQRLLAQFAGLPVQSGR